jgi:hypothetical protein
LPSSMLICNLLQELIGCLRSQVMLSSAIFLFPCKEITLLKLMLCNEDIISQQL